MCNSQELKATKAKLKDCQADLEKASRASTTGKSSSSLYLSKITEENGTLQRQVQKDKQQLEQYRKLVSDLQGEVDQLKKRFAFFESHRDIGWNN